MASDSAENILLWFILAPLVATYLAYLIDRHAPKSPSQSVSQAIDPDMSVFIWKSRFSPIVMVWLLSSGILRQSNLRLSQ